MRLAIKRTRRGAFSIMNVLLASLIIHVLLTLILTASSSITGVPASSMPAFNLTIPEGGGITSISDTGSVYVDQTSLWLRWYEDQGVMSKLLNTWKTIFLMSGMDETLSSIFNFLMNTLSVLGAIAFLRRG